MRVLTQLSLMFTLLVMGNMNFMGFTGFTGLQAAQEKKLYDIPLKNIKGEDTSLAAYKDKVILIVNVASKCGKTPQYQNLQALHKKYAKKGLVVVGFPANNFGFQEPGSNEEILQFCTERYAVEFPMMAKIDVKGDKQHPLYKKLIADCQKMDKAHQGEVRWNFEKFLLNRNGEIAARFRTRVNPEAPEVTEAIDALLAGKAYKQKAAQKGKKKSKPVSTKSNTKTNTWPSPDTTSVIEVVTGDDAKVKLNEAEAAFAKSLTGATLKGHYTITDQPGDLKGDAYDIQKIEKMNDKFWAFHAVVKYKKKDFPVVIPLPVSWNDGTPFISLTNLSIPGLGRFSARIMFFEDQYAGIWIAHGNKKGNEQDHGGQMFGKIIRKK